MSRCWSVRLLCLALVVLWVPGVFAQSQATTGVIEGTVTDPTAGGSSRRDGDPPQHRDQL